MTLKEISEKIQSLAATVADLVKSKATVAAEQFAEFQTQLKAIDTTVTGQLTQLQADLATAQQTIGTLTTQLTAATEQVNARDTEITNLKGQLAAADTKANDTIARQGIDPSLIPAGAATNGGGPAGESAWDKYNRLQATNPREAGAFYAANAAEIFRTRK